MFNSKYMTYITSLSILTLLFDISLSLSIIHFLYFSLHYEFIQIYWIYVCLYFSFLSVIVFEFLKGTFVFVSLTMICIYIYIKIRIWYVFICMSRVSWHLFQYVFSKIHHYLQPYILYNYICILKDNIYIYIIDKNMYH